MHCRQLYLFGISLAWAEFSMPWRCSTNYIMYVIFEYESGIRLVASSILVLDLHFDFPITVQHGFLDQFTFPPLTCRHGCEVPKIGMYIEMNDAIMDGSHIFARVLR